jgi:TRAF3-interacting protein 1
MAEEAYIAETQKVLGALIKKPKLVDKLLAKPPFRFIHDITKSVVQETGYLGDIFTEDELNADNILVCEMFMRREG